MLERDKSRVRYKSRILEELSAEGVPNPTAEEVLNFLLGDPAYHCSGSDYYVYKYKRKKPRTVFQRFNFLWVFPVFLVSLPFQWVFTGQTGITRNSRIGKVVDWLVKL